MRGKRVILDADLAELYGVATRRLNEQVSRNSERFPDDFAFTLEKQEFTNLMSQTATSSLNPGGHGGRRKAPRAFVKLRDLTYSQHQIQKKLTSIEQKVAGHDQTIHELINAVSAYVGSEIQRCSLCK